MPAKFSCMLIGHESVLISCGELLRKRGHEIRGVVSAGRQIRQWAEPLGISVLQPQEDLKAFLSAQPFDYLFSMANTRILSKEILDLPARLAINCHNSLLPKYGGVHATAWSILNEETTHGITWHVIAEVVDAGPIIRQEPILIDPDETAFTLDGKCYETAISSFSGLIDDLEQEKVVLREQNPRERTYFSATARPSAGCLLSWHRPANALSAFVRALDFGIHPNSLGLPKIATKDRYIVVTHIEVLEDSSAATPGTIVGFVPDALRVATASTDVVLRQLYSLDGQSLTSSDLREFYGLSAGDLLPEITEEAANPLRSVEAQLVQHESFWVRRLADLRPLALPWPSTVAPHRAPRLQHLPWQRPEAFEKLLNRREQASTSGRDLLAAVFTAFLSRVGQIHSFDLGFSHPGMPARSGPANAFFVPSVPLRIEIAEAHTLDDVLNTVTRQAAFAQKHITYSRDIVLRYVSLRSRIEELSYGFPIAIEYGDELPDNPAESLRYNGSSLTLFLPEDIHATQWFYDAEQLNAELVSRIQSQFDAFVQRVAQSPAQPIATLPLLSDSDQHLVEIAWNATQAEYPADSSIHRMFEAQVERSPQAIALTFQDQSLTYNQLNRRSNQLARHLQSLGIGPEALVGLYLDRSIDMIVGLLGILKAGGAYLPMDTAYPQGRLAFLLDDAEPRVILTQKRLQAQLPASPARAICLADEWGEIEKLSHENLQHSAAGDDLCYIIYTSGSAGTPKGVLVEHRSVCNLAAGLVRLFDVTMDSRILQFAAFSFDTSVAEIVMALCAGATLCLAPWSALLPGPELLQSLRELAITHVALPPSTLAVLPSDKLPELAALRVLIVAGEACPADLMATWSAGRRFFNGYGPTETTVCATVAECTQETGKPPIGHPFFNSQAYILDRHLRSVPIGVSGELHVGGVNLARGYHRRPDLTASKFIVNPFSTDPRARLYKTGDLARYRPDGAIEFVGRSDHQVKIRGFRIELEEIEGVLNLHPDVEQAAVNVHESSVGYRSLVAYVVSSGNRQLVPSELRHFLLERLPEYMVPERFVSLQAMPQTTSGKLDRRALPAPPEHQPERETGSLAGGDVERFLISLWSAMLGRASVSIYDNFFDQGGNSFLSLRTAERIGEEFGIQLPVVALYQYPTIEALAQHLSQKQATTSSLAKINATVAPTQHGTAAHRSRDIAIIGMAGRFPGAANVAELWEKLCAGEECISFFSDEELAPWIDADTRHDEKYVRAKGIVEGADTFDAAFFGITPKEAEIMDPQHRLFLEVAHESLDDAGYSPEQFDGAIGVYGGSGFMSYFVNNLSRSATASSEVGGLIRVLSNDKDYMTTRVAYKLNLRGPCVTVGTACSTSLVAVINAVTSLANHQCDMAIAGGATIDTPLKCGYIYEEEGMHSPDGHCRPFDARAQGTVMSNGVAAVVLRRLEDALRDGDHIAAVIRGVGINNDGSHRVSFSAPGVAGQAAAIAMAHTDAEINPETITYVEGHGTATPLGDPIEIAALTQAFRLHTSATGFCAIGSIKGNVGHLDTAAGVTGLIKVAMALRHRKLPPSLHFESPNPQIDFANSPFFVNSRLTAWKATRGPLRAGVSSFGMGGTNAHVICEQAPDIEPSGPSRRQQLLILSAKSAPALEAATALMAQHLLTHPDGNLADACYTLARGRSAMPFRRFVVGSDTADAARALTLRSPLTGATRYVAPQTPEIVFLFPGQGCQYLDMGKALYRQEEIFRNHVDICAEIIAPELKCDLRSILFASDSVTAALLHDTGYTQPAIFTISYALAKLWNSWGIHPRALMGHSIGEFVAACLAGVFSLEDALRLVVVRGQMMQQLPRGSMLSVRLSAAEMHGYLRAGLSIAAVNGPSLCVVSGPAEAISKLQSELEQDSVPCRLLQTSHAFHSAMVDPIVAPFTERCAQVRLSPPRVDIVSTVTGQWLTTEQATDPAYWGRHMRVPVRFAEGIQTLWKIPERVLLEVGPGTTAATLARQQIANIDTQTAISSLGTSAADDMELTAISMAVGQLWLTGARLDWQRYYQGEQRHRLALPSYPFERKRFWLEPERGPMTPATEVELLAYQPSSEMPRPRPEIKRAVNINGPVKVLKEILEQSTGFDMDRIPLATTFVAMGLDSLTLTQIAQRIQKQFHCRVTFRQLVDSYPNIESLANLLAQGCQPDAFAGSLSMTAEPSPQQYFAPAATRGTTNGNGHVPSAMPAEQARPFAGPGARIARTPSQQLTAPQRSYLEQFIERYTRQTAGSKAYVESHRLHLADPRTVSGFDPVVKEMVYPIVAARSEGVRLWDVDGNEYLDVVSGFGSSLFGYLPPFVKEAMRNQLEQGIEIGPQTPLAGEVAKLLCELTHLDRVTFCNTGSEAVLGAMRLARTVTGRSKIAIFSGSYHGIFDEVLVRGTKTLRPIPAAPGVTQEAVDNILVVDYDTPEALQILEANIGDLAAVLVEPVQSRRPDLQPRTFLHLLRRLTERGGAALIMDEMITGFRIDQGGAQSYFGVRGDMATYGKIMGGGMPIGALAGTAKFMDAIDGGYWRYGDNSAPEVDITYFAGTFVRHPLAMSAARAALEHMKAAGPDLQRKLNRRSDSFVAELNAFFIESGAPMRLVNFGSLLKLEFHGNVPYSNLLYYVMRGNGIHIGEHRPFFFTTAHSEADYAQIVEAFKEAVRELQRAGFLLLPEAESERAPYDAAQQNGAKLPPLAPVPGARLGRDPQGEPGWYVPDAGRPGKYVRVDALVS